MTSTRSFIPALLTLALLLGGILGVWIATTQSAYADGQSCAAQAYYDALGQSENSGRYDTCNSIGCCGKYQFCPSTLASLGYNRAEFLANPAQQEEAIQRFTANNYNYLVSHGAGQYIGQSINGVTVTWSGLLGAAHLGGAGGTMKMLESGGAYNPSDGATQLTQYMAKFAGYDTAAGSGGGTCGAGSNGTSTTSAGPICDPSVRSQVAATIDGTVAKANDFITTNFTPPPSISQVANSPCASKELTRISNQFTYAPSRYAQQLTGGLLSAGGPISGIMQNLFKSEFASINSAAASIPKMLNFQSMASSVMGDLMSSLGLGDAFSSQVCGLMVDMLLKYIQCENPIKLPNLGNIFGSLNNLIPNNCAGAALKSTLYAAGNMSSLKSLNQPVSLNGGVLSMGTKPQ